MKLSSHLAMVLAALSLAGCSALLGLEDVTLADGDAGASADADTTPIPALAVAVTTPLLRVERGSTETLEVSITRSGGLTGAVTVDLVLPTIPSGVTIVPATIGATETTGLISVTAANDAGNLGVGSHAATVQASASDAGDVKGETPATLLVADHPGVLDVSFNSSGVVLTSALTSARRVYVDPDGRVLVLGSGTLVVFTEAGAIDTSFASDGALTLDISAYDLAVRDQGRILVIGDKGGQLAIRAFTASGAIDATFGTLGEVTFQPATYGSSSGRAIAVGPDGSVYAGGKNGNSGTGEVWKFSSTGVGGASVSLSSFQTVQGLGVQSSGAVIAAGQLATMMIPSAVITRISSAMVVDTTFGTSGDYVMDDCYLSDDGFGIGDNDTIAVAGKTATGSQDIIGLVGPDGASVFKKAGTSNTSGSPNAHGAAVDASGRVLYTAGGVAGGVYYSAEILRFLGTAPATLDVSFDGDGRYLFDGMYDGAPHYSLNDVTIGPDGRIVSVGVKDSMLMVVRYWD